MFYVESTPLVLKDKRSCFSQGERFTRYSCLLIVRLSFRSRMLNWHNFEKQLWVYLSITSSMLSVFYKVLSRAKMTNWYKQAK